MQGLHLLAGISSFKEGIDCFCESSGYRQCVLSPHGERTGPSGAAWQEQTHTHTKEKSLNTHSGFGENKRTNSKIQFLVP